MNKNLTKKALVPAIAMVLASVIALSGVTYAWFTTGTTASVNTLEVNVKTADGIQVSVDANVWKSVITATDISSVDAAIYKHTNQLPTGDIEPVSSAGNVVDGKLQLFHGMFDEATGNLVSSASVEQRGNGGFFVAFDLFFKSGGEDKTLKLVPGTDGDSAYVHCASVGGDGDVNANTHTAVRVAFVNLGHTTGSEADARSLNGEGLTDNVKIWEPNATIRSNGSNGAKITTYGFNSAFAGVAPVDGFVPADNSNVSSVTTFEGEQNIVTLKAGITKVRVYIWLEGQDVDCVNSISFGDFVTNLFFDVA